MEFNYLLPTKILFGAESVSEHKKEIAKFGKRAFVVTGGSSGRRSGALNDILAVFQDCAIAYEVFDKVENNPTLENVAWGGEEAKKFGADFVVGIGGGSPLDAAKAIAVLAVNEIPPVTLFTNVFANKPLPIIAIPTTAGTGSEVTPYAILTRKDLETKRSFGNEDTFPKLAIMDPAYTASLPREVTVNTAVDAFSHGLESFLSKRSTAISDIFARQCIKEFAGAYAALIQDRIDDEIRSKLLYCSMLGGMAIAHTGTTIVHAMGYSLTYFKGIPHGRANGLLMTEYLRFNYSGCKEKIDEVLSMLRLTDIDAFGSMIAALMNNELSFSQNELPKYAALAMEQKSVANNTVPVVADDLLSILERSLKKE